MGEKSGRKWEDSPLRLQAKNHISVPNATLNSVCSTPSVCLSFALFWSFLGLVFEFEFAFALYLEEGEDVGEGGEDGEEGGR
jgi:hypothetical protein